MERRRSLRDATAKAERAAECAQPAAAARSVRGGEWRSGRSETANDAGAAGRRNGAPRCVERRGCRKEGC